MKLFERFYEGTLVVPKHSWHGTLYRYWKGKARVSWARGPNR